MMKKGKWSKEEDNLLKSHIEKYGRCGRSCRSRWLNYLRPGLKHGNFTPAEETIICEMYSKRGSCWSVIAARLPGRTDLAVKNYWNSTLKKKFPAATRRNLPACSTSTDAGTPARDLQLISYSSHESSTPGSSPVKPAMAGLLPVQAVQPQALLIAGVQAPITAVPVKIEKTTPPPPPALS
nr:unnamed protein product [Digitaria exilis]